MARESVRPTIVIIPLSTGERTITEAFGEAYARYFDDVEAKSSEDTFVSGKLSDYNLAIPQRRTEQCLSS